jgi:signal peptidase II
MPFRIYEGPTPGPRLLPETADPARRANLGDALGAALRQTPISGLAVCATAVAIVDLGTKQIAATILGARGDVPVPLIGHVVRLAVVLNDQSAFGVSLGPYTWHINLVLTAIALFLSVVLCRALAAVDSWAPLMLGLIAGAATGNLVSLVLSPQGVPDFIAVQRGSGQELVFNLADVAAVIGVLLLVRTLGTVGQAILASRAEQRRGFLAASRPKIESSDPESRK